MLTREIKDVDVMRLNPRQVEDPQYANNGSKSSAIRGAFSAMAARTRPEVAMTSRSG